MRRVVLGVAVVLLASCGGSPAQRAADGPPAADAAPPWSLAPPPSSIYGPRRGLRVVRGVIHAHTAYSHDACDGEPVQNGVTNQPCLDDFRAALCKARLDYVMLTDHDDRMAGQPFERLLLDLPIVSQGGAPIGAVQTCPDGSQVTLLVGGENGLMPVGLDQHPPGDEAARAAAYDAEDEAAVALFRALGAVVLVPHTESRSLALLRRLRPDGIEIYNLHANVDPRIRETWLGLPAYGAVEAIAPFIGRDPETPEPDLALLGMLEPNRVALASWDALLSEGPMVGTAGTDCHQNAFPVTLKDDERGDSYRRMMRWFSNVLLVRDTSPGALKEALGSGRLFVVFDVFGTPADLDFFARTPDGTAEVGQTVAPASTLVVRRPQVAGLSGSLQPDVRIRLLRARPGGAVEVASSATSDLAHRTLEPGAYRAEVLITPRHLAPLLGSLSSMLVREYVWVYTNAIHVR